MAIKAKAQACSSTYLDIGLRHIGRLTTELVNAGSITKSNKIGTTYQSAHDDLAGSSRGNGGGVNHLGRSLAGLRRLLNTTNGRLCGGAATSATATSVLATVADEIVERLVQVGRHSDELV
jgi:hypothetical protein